jgi:hypothetical protein
MTAEFFCLIDIPQQRTLFHLSLVQINFMELKRVRQIRVLRVYA